MGQILQTVVSHFWLIALAVLALVAWRVLRQPRVKVWKQERAEQRVLRQDLNSLLYVDMAGVELATEQGPLRISHVLVSPYGVYVINVLHMSGDIEGEERHGHWAVTQGKQVQKFANPLAENELRCEAVQKLLQLPPEQVHSVVLFMGRCEFLSRVPANVTQPSTLVACVRRHLREVFTPEQMQGFIDRLSRLRKPSSSANPLQMMGALASEKMAKPGAKKGARRAAKPVEAARAATAATPQAPQESRESRRPAPEVAAATAAVTSAESVVPRAYEDEDADDRMLTQPAALGGRHGQQRAAAGSASAGNIEPARAEVKPPMPLMPKFALSSVKEVDISLSLFPDESELSSTELAGLGLPPVSMDLMTAPAPLPEMSLPTEVHGSAEHSALRVAKPVAQLRTVCPQCGGALRLIAISRGPLAGSAFQRCTQVDSCDYAQPIAKKPKKARKPKESSASDSASGRSA